MSFFRNWFYLYIKSTAAESAFEHSISKIGQRYRVEFPFPSIRRVVDFTLPDSKIVIEVDGASHLEPNQRRKDLISSIALEKLGWRVIRFTNEEVLRDPQAAVASIPERVATRPTLAELGEALLQLPSAFETQSKRRVPGPKPAPKKALKLQKAATVRKYAQPKQDKPREQD